MDISIFLIPDFSAGPCCCSHSMRTRVTCVGDSDQECFFSRPTMAIVPGERLPTTGSTRLPPIPPSVASCGGDGGGGGGGVAGVFLFS